MMFVELGWKLGMTTDAMS